MKGMWIGIFGILWPKYGNGDGGEITGYHSVFQVNLYYQHSAVRFGKAIADVRLNTGNVAYIVKQSGISFPGKYSKMMMTVPPFCNRGMYLKPSMGCATYVHAVYVTSQ